jgi:nicotinamide-nucleotide adenylyltransferase
MTKENISPARRRGVPSPSILASGHLSRHNARMSPEKVARLAMVARWKPVHLGHAAVLESLVARADHAFIGIGSSNKYDVRNPFTADETEEMLRLVLAPRTNFSLVRVPDLDHGPRWRAMLKDLFGPLDLFVTENGWVVELLRDDYQVVHPVKLVPKERHVAVDGTMVRRALARGDDWRALVPPVIAAHLERTGLAARFVREFGLATLALEASGS